MSASPATEHKEKGNASFKAGNYPEAIGHYTAAILADSTDPTFPLNRAAAYLKLNKNQDAERDCSTVLKLQPTNVKAMFRRAQAKIGLGNFSDARTDLLAAAKADPGNAAVRAEFSKVEELIAEAAKKTKTSKGTPISVPSHPPGQSSRPPYRRRVPIAIKDDDEVQSDKRDEAKPIDGAKQTQPKGILKGASTPTASTSSTPSKSPESPSTSTRSKDLLTPVSTRAISASPQDRSPTPISVPAPAPAAETPMSIPLVSTPPETQTLVPTIQPTLTTATTAATAPLSPAGPLPSTPSTASPPTLITFLQKWTNANSDAERAHILYTVPPDSIPTLFGPTLESPLLGAMLAALSWSVTAFETEPVRERAIEYMRALARVPRFTTLVMFLDGKEKKHAAQVWDAVGSAGDERKRWGVEFV
ncbi:hypothetical protein FRC12_005034 [Ceratobasidium sp. 428]|nr:hypothetical protein FRC12_005034 [Ceratobasidium sp. 428]